MSRSRRERTRWRPETRWRHAQPPGSFDSVDQPELIRYVGPGIDEDSGERLGIFQIMGRLVDSKRLEAAEHAQVSRMLRWFSRNLAQPRRFSHYRHGMSRSAAGDWVRTPIALSWFKPHALVHLSRIESCAELLRKAGIDIEIVRTRLPGYITYEDQHQVVAVAFPR